MFRYISFIWNPSDHLQSDTVRSRVGPLQHSPNWETVVRVDGLHVLCSGARHGASEAHLLKNRSGAVLGTVFEREPNSKGAFPRARFDDSSTSTIVVTSGRHLVGNYWGQYVAFVIDSALSKTFVVADPVGGLPCYFVRFQGIYVCFSDIETCTTLGFGPFSIDWMQLSVNLATGMPPVNGATTLSDVSVLRAGESLDISQRECTRRFYWNPFEIAASNVLENPSEAVSALRKNTQACVSAWASGHSNILHRLSGGIDSNIVLACLRASPTNPGVTCLNYYSPGSDTDERELARLGIARTPFALVEKERNSRLRLESIFDVKASPNPWSYLAYLENSPLERDLAAASSATAVFDGGSGDGVFYESRAMFGAGDYVYRRGLRPGLLRVAYDIARLERSSFWTVVRNGLSDGRMRNPWNPLSDQTRARKFSKVNVSDLEKSLLVHPWFDNPQGTPNGKRWHAYLMAVPLGFYDPYGLDGDPEHIHPIQSQPLIELCLRIPTYVLTFGGWGRSVARHAFSDVVPSEIIWRRTKGGLQEHMNSIMMLNLKLIRETILDGVLVRQGLLERERIEDYLSGRPTTRHRVGGAMAEVFEYLCLEVWLRRMSHIRQVAAA